MSQPIEIHVLGSKKGESIVVRLPGNIWGVVDNYTPRIADPDSNPTLRFLRQRGVSRLGFLCLTHPHEDHYRGMSHLLKTFSPDKVWLFGTATHRDLYDKVAKTLKAGAESRNVDRSDSENADELVSFLDQIRSEYTNKRRDPRLEVIRLQLGMQLLKLASNPPVLVQSIGASGGRAMLYESTLADCFSPDGQFLAERLPRVNHNMISGGLLIEYGQARIILGGDIDREAWEETVRSFPRPELLRAELVKVSHHGSVTGYCPGLWQKFSPGGTSVAVITPYPQQGLPSAEALAHISQNVKGLFSASVDATALATDWRDAARDTGFEGVSADVLVTLRSVFPKATRPAERLEGMCSFEVGDDGFITNTMHDCAGRLAGS